MLRQLFIIPNRINLFIGLAMQYFAYFLHQLGQDLVSTYYFYFLNCQ
jgi:hypothetical protein